MIFEIQTYDLYENLDLLRLKLIPVIFVQIQTMVYASRGPNKVPEQPPTAAVGAFTQVWIGSWIVKGKGERRESWCFDIW